MYVYLRRLLPLAFAIAFVSCGDGGIAQNPLTPGQTDFVTNETNEGGNYRGGGLEDANAPGAADSQSKGAPSPEPPNGRTGEVEEADIYRVDNNHLFYLNTYRGFVIYDVNDPQNPKRVSRLPVFGYPIEMFIKGTTVYALLRDALYLTQVDGKLQFQRHNVSQLVTIDIADIKNPKVLKKVDIVGELREGVSRKIEDTIYVVSYIPQSYYWGWGYNNQDPDKKEQAWVYSFNVADAKNPLLVQELQLFEGGSYSYHDPITKQSGSRNFSGVAISATSNTLMVVENWQRWGYQPDNFKTRCGSYESTQQAVISVVDISDPTGTIKVHSKFETLGQLTDQFKQTYVYDPVGKTGTYYGIFARREWSSSDCSGGSLIRNTIESWDITDGDTPAKLSSLDFGKPDETVRGSAFDPEREVAYAITARNIDPLYVISLADRNNLKVLSAIDGLSGDMSVFRLLAGNDYLMGIGRDNTQACGGFADPNGPRATNIAVSIIDVRNLSNIKLMQRECVAIENASWVGSELTWNLDQAHKMIGMHSDGKVNVITVPVYYNKKTGDGDWWWYRYETAVGIMTWDVTKYDATKSHLEQKVLENYGTFVHPNGQVKRSIVFTHKGTTDRRMMINLSDTHISVADIEDLANPQLLSTVELAPHYDSLYSFGSHLVEHVRSTPYYYYGSNEAKSEFRVKAAGPGLEDQPPVASFSVGQVERVIKFKDKLVLFRRLPGQQKNGYYTEESEALIYDLSDPTQPKQAGSIKLPGTLMPYYYYWCGVDAWWGPYRFGGYGSQYDNWVVTDAGLVFLTNEWDPTGQKQVRKLVFLGLQNAQQPTIDEYTLSTAQDWTFLGLVADPVDPSSFFLSYRIKLGQTKVGNSTFYQFKYYAQRWNNAGKGWSGGYAVNLPGQLIRTWVDGNKQRVFLTHDRTYKLIQTQNNYDQWGADFRLNLLRQLDVLGKPAAELRDSYVFKDYYLEDLVVDGGKLFVNSRQNWYSYVDQNIPWYERSDHLTIFDTANLKLDQRYSEPTATYQVNLMGTYQGKLFVNLPGDGVLVVDVSDPTKPAGKQFVRTLGWASHIQFAGDRAYIPAGYFGIYELDLSASSTIPVVSSL